MRCKANGSVKICLLNWEISQVRWFFHNLESWFPFNNICCILLIRISNPRFEILPIRYLCLILILLMQSDMTEMTLILPILWAKMADRRLILPTLVPKPKVNTHTDTEISNHDLISNPSLVEMWCFSWLYCRLWINHVKVPAFPNNVGKKISNSGSSIPKLTK